MEGEHDENGRPGQPTDPREVEDLEPEQSPTGGPSWGVNICMGSGRDTTQYTVHGQE